MAAKVDTRATPKVPPTPVVDGAIGGADLNRPTAPKQATTPLYVAPAPSQPRPATAFQASTPRTAYAGFQHKPRSVQPPQPITRFASESVQASLKRTEPERPPASKPAVRTETAIEKAFREARERRPNVGKG